MPSTHPLRIAIVANTAWYLANFRLNLMVALEAAGHQVVAVAPEAEQASRLHEAGIRFHPVAISGAGTHPLEEMRTVLALRRAFHANDIDLVLSYTPKGNLYSALACLSAGRAFVPNVSGLGRAFVNPSPLTRVMKLLYRLTFSRARKVFFQNQEDMDTFIAAGLVPARLSERLPGSGVDLVRFQAMPSASRAADAAVFLLVARMLWDKGVGEFVDAARQVLRQYPRARFQLLGFADVANPSAITRAQLDAWTAEGTVSYLGATDDVRPWLVQADCAVLPSKYREGVPRTLLEAAATGRPVITTDAPGCRDTVVDGVSGYLCRPGDAGDLAAQLLRFMALAPDQRRAMGERGRAHVERYFDERLVIDRYLAVVADAPSRR